MLLSRFLMIPKKLNEGVSKQVLSEGNCLVLFWRFKTASNSRKQGLNASECYSALHTIESFELMQVCYLPVYELLLLVLSQGITQRVRSAVARIPCMAVKT